MKLIFQARPTITIATNTFVNVPVILKYENTPLFELIQEQHIGFTIRVSIYHPDGTYLAKVTGNRIFRSEGGKKANVNVRDTPDKFICSLGNQELFEISHGRGQQPFKAEAELYTLDGHFLKCTDTPKPALFDMKGNAIEVSGRTMTGYTFKNLSVGIWLRRGGSYSIGVM